jgi:hypothetical protein
MDLRTQFPRSPRERVAGVAMFARTIDKARAQLAGTLGEFIYDCPMGVDAEEARLVEAPG